MSGLQLFHGGRVALHAGDCLERLAEMPDACIDAVVTDPPYHLTSIVKRFGASGASAAKDYSGEREGATGAFARASRGFMGKTWDGGDIAFRVELWAQIFRVLKPRGHVAAFSGTRTYHRIACAIEDAGFEVRDQLAWCYGSGFPKSHDVSKGIDRAAGVAREVIGEKRAGLARKARAGAEMCGGEESFEHLRRADISIPSTDAARKWHGWGTALKPAWEPICLARKPLAEGTVAANVLAHGCGAINVDACRVETEETIVASRNVALGSSGAGVFGAAATPGVYEQKPGGRWPANIVHDGSPEVLAAFPESSGQNGAVGPRYGARAAVNCYGDYGPRPEFLPRGDSGSAARFFYTAKADAEDRLGSKHPTVKPVDLMRWLVRLITPPGGTVLDPFAGTGTTGAAAFHEGFSAVLIERDEEYRADIARRMALLLASSREKKIASIKVVPSSVGPLFDGGGQ